MTSIIQKLRKSSGIAIEDKIEVFYQLSHKVGDDSMMHKLIDKFGKEIQKTIKKPFHDSKYMQNNASMIVETVYENPEDPKDWMII